MLNAFLFGRGGWLDRRRDAPLLSAVLSAADGCVCACVSLFGIVIPLTGSNMRVTQPYGTAYLTDALYYRDGAHCCGADVPPTRELGDRLRAATARRLRALRLGGRASPLLGRYLRLVLLAPGLFSRGLADGTAKTTFHGCAGGNGVLIPSAFHLPPYHLPTCSSLYYFEAWAIAVNSPCLSLFSYHTVPRLLLSYNILRVCCSSP